MNKRLYIVSTLSLFIVGVLFLAISKGNHALVFLGLFLIGGGFISLGKVSILNYQENLIKLDKNIDFMLKDIEINGEQSEYYEFVTPEKSTLVLNDFIKKNKRKFILFYIMGGVMIVSSFFMLL